MMQLTCQNNPVRVVNSDLIKCVENPHRVVLSPNPSYSARCQDPSSLLYQRANLC